METIDILRQFEILRKEAIKRLDELNAKGLFNLTSEEQLEYKQLYDTFTQIL